MNAISEQDYQEDIFRNNDEIIIHCVDPSYSFELTVPSLPFLSLRVIYCHFNFVNSPSERRLLLIPSSDDMVRKFSDLNSPCLVRVLRSIIFQCHPDEVVEQDQEILLCWDFLVLQANANAMPPANPETDDLNFAPLLDFSSVVCNCSKYPDIGSVVLVASSLDNSLEEDNNDDQLRALVVNENEVVGSESSVGSEVEEEDWEEELDEEEVIHTLPFKCIGAAHERLRQQHLDKAEEVMRLGGDVSVRLRPDQQNQYDRFAIAIDIAYGSGWFHAGYIARELTKYLHPLMETNRIVSVSLEHIKFRVYFAKIGFYPKVLITRKGAWEHFVVNRSRSVR